MSKRYNSVDALVADCTPEVKASECGFGGGGMSEDQERRLMELLIDAGNASFDCAQFDFDGPNKDPGEAYRKLSDISIAAKKAVVDYVRAELNKATIERDEARVKADFADESAGRLERELIQAKESWTLWANRHSDAEAACDHNIKRISELEHELNEARAKLSQAYSNELDAVTERDELKGSLLFIEDQRNQWRKCARDLSVSIRSFFKSNSSDDGDRLKEALAKFDELEKGETA